MSQGDRNDTFAGRTLVGMLLLFEILSQGDRKDTFARSTLAGMLLLFDVMNQGDRKGAPVQYTSRAGRRCIRILYGRTLAVALNDVIFCIGSNARQYA